MSLTQWLFPPAAPSAVDLPKETQDSFFASSECLDLLVKFEGIALLDNNRGVYVPYLCPAGFWTIGVGHVLIVGGKMLHGAENRAVAMAQFPRGLTKEQCIDLLHRDLPTMEKHVNDDVAGFETTQWEFDAMVSMAYNVGPHALETSSVLRFHKAGAKDSTVEDADARQRFGMNHLQPDNAADAFLLWDMAGGRILNGLVDRRMAERNLYLGG